MGDTIDKRDEESEIQWPPRLCQIFQEAIVSCCERITGDAAWLWYLLVVRLPHHSSLSVQCSLPLVLLGQWCAFVLNLRLLHFFSHVIVHFVSSHTYIIPHFPTLLYISMYWRSIACTTASSRLFVFKQLQNRVNRLIGIWQTKLPSEVLWRLDLFRILYWKRYIWPRELDTRQRALSNFCDGAEAIKYSSFPWKHPCDSLSIFALRRWRLRYSFWS